MTVARSSQVVRDSGDDPNDPFDYGTLLDTVTVNGRSSTSLFDKDAGTETVNSPLGRTTTIEYDENDRPERVLRDGRDNTRLAYDVRGRLISVMQSGFTSKTTYGTDGYVALSEDEQGGVTTYVRDDTGRPVEVTGPDGETTEVAYDAAGQTTKLTAPDGRELDFTYDADGNRTSTTRGSRPLSGDDALTTEVEYDDAGRVAEVIRPSREEVSTTRDPYGRLTSTEAADGTETTRSYTPIVSGEGSQLSGLSTETGNELELGWDGSLLESIAVSGDAPPSAAADPAPDVAISYDDSLRITQQTIGTGAGSAVGYSYNDDDQLTAAGPLTIGYNAASGDPTTFVAGQTSTTLDLDGRGSLIGLHYSADQGGAPSPVLSQSPTRDGLGRIISLGETVEGVASPLAEYSYDDAGRLTAVSKGGSTAESYMYDETGALISRGSGLLATFIAVDGHGRPTSSGDGRAYDWSDDGELIDITGPGAVRTEFEYDGFGRLDRVELPDGRVGTYRYDALGRRTAASIDGVMVRRLLYGGSEWPQARLDADGDVLERYVYASQAHVPDLIVRRDGTTWRLVTDVTGSVRAVIDTETGAVVQKLSYSAYGQVLTDTNPGLQPFGFKGSYSDPIAEGAGLVWMGVRTYQPALARFTTADPAGIAAGWNQHDGLLSDPVNRIDPDARFVAQALLGTAILLYAGVQLTEAVNDNAREARDNRKKREDATKGRFRTASDAIRVCAEVLSEANSILDGLAEAAGGEFWRSLQPHRQKVRTNGKSGKDKRYYYRDRTHDDLEVYDHRGRHRGSARPETGEIYKPRQEGRDKPDWYR